MKTKTRILKIGFYIAILLIILSTCKIGLGESVDIYPPNNVTITYPLRSSIIKGNFTLEGTADDDFGVKEVTVSLNNTSRADYNTVVKKAQYNRTTKKWSILIENKDEGTIAGHPLVKKYTYPDGKYIITVTAFDEKGDKTSTSFEYSIDNTPPVLIVNRPSTLYTENNIDVYGPTFKLVGQAADSHTIKKATIKVRDKDNNPLSTGGGGDFTLTQEYPNTTINRAFASAGTSDYNTMQPSTTNDPPLTLRAGIFLSDNAQNFNGSNQSPMGEGNTSSFYYLEANLNSFLAKGYTSQTISDYFSGFKGNEAGTEDEQKLAALWKDSDFIKILNDAKINADDYKSAFKLNAKKNPTIKSPSLTIFEQKNSTDTTLTATKTPEIFQNSPIPIILEPNKDGTPIKTQNTATPSSKNYLVLFFNKNNKEDITSINNVTLNNDDFNAIWLYDFEKSVANSKQNVIVETQGLTYNITYTIGEEKVGFYGLAMLNTENQTQLSEDIFDFNTAFSFTNIAKDSDGNDFTPRTQDGIYKEGGRFIFKLKATGSPPQIQTPQFSEEYYSTPPTTTVPILELGDYNVGSYTMPKYTIDKGSTSYDLSSTSSTPNDKKFTLIVDNAAFTNLPDGSHSIEIMATNDVSTNIQTIYFKKDTTPPTIEIRSPQNKEQVTGIVKISSVTNDSGSGVKLVKYLIPKRTNPTSGGNKVTDNDWQPYQKTSPEWTTLNDINAPIIQFGGQGTNPKLLKEYANTTYAMETAPSSKIWQIPILFYLEDKVGNHKITKPTDYYLKVDPNGDIPKVAVSYPIPKAGESSVTLGGIIRVSGTASDNIRVKSVWIQIDAVDDNNDFDTTAETKLKSYIHSGAQIYTTETQNNVWGVKVTGTNSWNITLNEHGEFEPATGTIQKIKYRVRSQDNDDNFSPWSETITVFVDKTNPKIGSSAPLKLVQYQDNANGTGQVTAEKNYIPDMWISGKWWLTGSIEDESGINKVTISGLPAIGTITLSNTNYFKRGRFAGGTWQENIPVNGSEYDYTINVPIAAGSSNLEITLNVTDSSSPSGATTQELRINRDTNPPTTADLTARNKTIDMTNAVYNSNNEFSFGSQTIEAESGFDYVAFWLERTNGGTTQVYNVMEKSNTTVLSSATSGNDLRMINKLPRITITGGTRSAENTFEHTSIGTNKNIRKGGLIYIGGVDRVITDINGNTVTFEGNAPQTLTTAQFAYIMRVNNMTIETRTSPTTIANDDGDGMVESVERSGGKFTWTATIDSKNIPDGPITIKYIVVDKAGNASEVKSTNTKIINNPPRIAKVTLGTDLNGNGIIDSNEKISYPLNGITTIDALSGTNQFTAKAYTEVIPEILGGNGDLHYEITLKDTSPNLVSVDTSSNNSRIREGTGNTINPIKMTVDSNDKLFGTVENGEQTFVFTIWDSTTGYRVGADTQKAEITVKMHVATEDEVSPMSVISPFEWTSKTDNSLYENKAENGHIELEADLPATFTTGGTGVNDRDPKVSGKISIRGTAYDDQRLTEIWAKIDDFTFTGTGLTTQPIGANIGMVRLAQYTNGTWNLASSGGNMAQNGWHFAVTDKEIKQDGHRIEWQLDWDSSRVAGVAGLDKTITIITKDRSTNGYSSATVAGTNANEKTYNKPTYKVDIVPYITEIGTQNRLNSGLKNTTIRSASGKYSIMKGNVSNFITVTGFNLNPQIVRLVSTANLATATSTTGTQILHTTANATHTEFSLTNNLSHSGYLELFNTGNIRALNNINNNSAKGSYTGNDTENMPNMEPNRDIRNPTLTDDRYLRVFDMKETDMKNGYYPTMIMDGDNPVFGYVNYSGGPSTDVGTGANTGAGVFSSTAQPQRGYFSGTTGATTQIEYLIKGISWDQMSMAKDEAGRYIHLTTYNYSKAAMSVIYDRYTELHGNSGLGWGAGPTYTTYINLNGNYALQPNNNAIVLETVSYNSLLLGRYQYPKIIAKGNSTTSAGASIYMAYYDDNTSNKEIILRNFKIGTDTGLGYPLYNGNGYNQYTNLQENTSETTAQTTPSNTYATGRLTGATSASKYFDMAVTSDNHILLVYFDEAAGTLKLRYSTNPVTGTNPTDVINWTESSITFPNYVGMYVSMTLDDNNGVHIAAFDSSDADLEYLYIPTYTGSSITEMKVDAAFSVGQWTQIKVRNNKPYIAYYNSSEAGSRESIKLAYANNNIGAITQGADENGYTAGGWEYMTVPSVQPAQGGDPKFKQVSLDFDSAGKPVVGYLGTNLEFGSWLDE